MSTVIDPYRDLRPEDPWATVAPPGEDQLNPPVARWPQTRQTEELPPHAPGQLNFGPGKELPAGDPHPARHELTYTVRPMAESWRADWYTGMRASIGEVDEDAQHYGYREPWDVKLPNDRGITVGTANVPWDYGLSAPVVTSRGFRV